MRLETGISTPDPQLVVPTSEEVRRISGTLPYIEASTVKRIIDELESFKSDIPDIATLENSSKKQIHTFLRGLMEMGMQRVNIPVQTQTGTTWPVYDMFTKFHASYFTGKTDCGGCYNGAMAGAGFVYEAFGRQIGQTFDAQFRNIVVSQPELLDTAIDQSMTVNGREYLYTERNTWFTRMNPYLQIPEYQGSLRAGIEHLQTRLPGIIDPIEDGAISAYRTLEALSTHLTPPQA